MSGLVASSAVAREHVYLEAGNTRVFACSLEWPGWCRRAKTDEEALDVLAEYAPRYAIVPQRAGVRLPPRRHPTFEVVERIAWRGGDKFSAVDFGALGAAAQRDSEPLTAAQAKRLAALVEASWAVLDDVVAGAPAELRKGPRGGGRDRDKVFAHVVAAESVLRAQTRRPASSAAGSRRRSWRCGPSCWPPLAGARAGAPAAAKGWLPRYAARRIAWHVLDHAWEIEDRS